MAVTQQEGPNAELRQDKEPKSVFNTSQNKRGAAQVGNTKLKQDRLTGSSTTTKHPQEQDEPQGVNTERSSRCEAVTEVRPAVRSNSKKNSKKIFYLTS